MSILGKVFSAGAGELVKNVGGVLDNLTTTNCLLYTSDAADE